MSLTTNYTILDIIDEGLKKNGTGNVLNTKRNGKWIPTSVEEFKEKVRNFALGLHDLGIKKGDRVALHSENSTEWIIADQAILSLGAVNVPIYTTQPGDQIKYILENSEAKIYVCSKQELFEGFAPHVSSVSTLKHVVGIVDVTYEKALTMDDVMAKGAELHAKDSGLFEKMKSEVSPDDYASFIYTSGTTGVPKGVILTHGNIASNVMSSLDRVPFTEDQKDLQILSFLPLSHIFERMLDYLYIYLGFSIHYIEVLEEIVDDIKNVKPHFFATVPRLLEKVYAKMRSKPDELSGLKKKLFIWALHLAENKDLEDPNPGFKYKIADKLIYSKIREGLGGNLLGMISGGAALTPQVMRFFNSIGLYCGQGYGLTETSPVIAVTAKDANRVGSVGKPIQGVEVKIADDGEILCKGPNVMQGYYKLPDKTAEVLVDGWFHTGDIGKFDNDGFLYITDRKKDLFKLSTGKYVAPSNIEGELANSLLIEQCCVLGNGRKFCSALIIPSLENIQGKVPEMVAEKMPDDPKVRELIQAEVDEVNAKLPKWEQVKKFEILSHPLTIETGELTPTMKMKRPVVKEKYKKQIENIYKED